MLFSFWSRYISEKTTYAFHKNVIVEVESYTENSSKSNTPYTVKFQYNGKKYSQGIWRSTFRNMGDDWKIELHYNEREDYFIDKNLTAKNISVTLVFAILILIAEIYLIWGLLTGKYKRWM